ncbi:MAG: [protein-PII] uridylyltransferase, partial [Pseudomonadota bacterium]
PHSDIDILFAAPEGADIAWLQPRLENILYPLWDIGLKVGHAVRVPSEVVAGAKDDLTIATAMLEARHLLGDAMLSKSLIRKFFDEVVTGEEANFIELKLAERDARHKRMGDSRYVVEPNLKDGKGGLRDLHTLYWLARHLYRVDRLVDLVPRGILRAEEARAFARAETFLLTVRYHLHRVTGRPEERLTFDVQPELARRLRYQDRRGLSGVERFMKHYFYTAKQVGDLTRVFCAHLEETHRRRLPHGLAVLTRQVRNKKGFRVDYGRINIPHEDFFAEDPVRMLQIFAVSHAAGVDLHPQALRALQRDNGKISTAVRRLPEANKHFLEVLTSAESPEVTLRRMNEAGVLGKFVPDFGRIVGQMQFDMYHHYTVDEHTIHAIGLLAAIERGDFAEDHPLSTQIISKVNSRRVLYCAVLFHDIAKGRGGDHSTIGARIARRVSARFGLEAAEADQVAWLVQNHLLMSNYAFKRDLSDFKTVLDFVSEVKSPERLRLLLILTVVDIRAVGPGIWNGWKGQLLRELYSRAEEVLIAGHASKGRAERIAARKEELAAALSTWSKDAIRFHLNRFYDPYWIGEEPAIHLANAEQIANADAADDALSFHSSVDTFLSMTRFSVYAADFPGIFYRLAGSIALAGASIADAKLHITRDGQVLANFVVQDMDGTPVDEERRLAKLRDTARKALTAEIKLADALRKKPVRGFRKLPFEVEPVVIIDNKASNRYTVVEVNALDRPALLYHLARALYDAKTTLHSAHVATYGERAVDVFYLTDLLDQKIESAARLRTLEKKLFAALVESGRKAAA